MMLRSRSSILFHFVSVSLIAIALPFLVPSEVLATEMLAFSMAAIGCNLLLGYTGLLSFGQALFFGSGAYLASLIAMKSGLSLIPTMIATALGGALIAVVVGFIAIRRKGIYFVMLTLAFGQLGYYIAFLAEPITGGEDGLLDIPRPELSFPGIGSLDLSSNAHFYAFTAVVFVAMFVLMQRMVDSPLGSVLRAIRQNEDRAEAIGYQIRWYKIAVFAFSGAVTALAGALYAFMLHFAPLSNIDIETSERILFMCVLGGLGSLYGSIVGAIVFLLASDFFSELWPRWMLLFGFSLIIIMLYLPGGLWRAIIEFSERIFPWVKGASAKGVPND